MATTIGPTTFNLYPEYTVETPTMQLRWAVYPNNPHGQILEQMFHVAHSDGRVEHIWKPVEIVEVKV